MMGRRLMLMLSCVAMLGVIASTYAVDKPDVRDKQGGFNTVFHLASLQIPAGNTFAATVVSDPSAQVLEQEELSSLVEFMNNDPAIQKRLKTYWAEKDRLNAGADDPIFKVQRNAEFDSKLKDSTGKTLSEFRQRPAPE